jgi:predicted Ser/Thr protein kinase
VAIETRVGPYRIVRLVNRGGQGSVYLGYDKRLRRRVAIKIYDLPPGRAARRQLLQEARVVASLDSPKIVPIHDVIESSEHLAMVMAYIPGCDLAEFLAAVRPSLASVLTIGADIAGALAVAKQQHVVHGDLKAANVLITETGRVKLTDFGIARRSAGGGEQRAGSLTALSPEQYLGKPIDARSDLFALGCLLYRMLGGVPPFVRNGKFDARLLLEQDPPSLAELAPAHLALPPELPELVTALLQKDPRDRPANTRLVRRVLRRAARGLPLAANNSLLQEARPCFRRESPEDIPPAVPPDLGRDGRSRLLRTAPGGLRLWRSAVPHYRFIAGATALALVAALALVLHRRPGETRVHIDEPVLRLVTSAGLPEEISSRWLVGEVSRAVAERLGPLRVTGPVGATPVTTLNTARARDGETEAAERLQLGLRCVDLFCVFAVSRNNQAQRYSQQAVLFPDMPIRQWRDTIRSTTLALYR